jgi:hypothetical protein
LSFSRKIRIFISILQHIRKHIKYASIHFGHKSCWNRDIFTFKIEQTNK